MRKKLEIDLYRTALSVLHRLLAYQIKHKARLGTFIVGMLMALQSQLNSFFLHSQVSLVAFLASPSWATQVLEFPL